MNRFIYGVAQAINETFELPQPRLEIGSYQVPEQKAINNLRPIFGCENYIGLDIRPGPGVDVVGSIEDLPQEDHSVGTIIALNTLEHVTRFWRGFEEMQRVLRPDGVVFLSVPFYFHIHNHPSDYWRFTPEALKVMLEPYPQVLLGWHGPCKKPANVWALAFGPDYPKLNTASISKYCSLVKTYAKEPMNPFRKWKYRLGRWLLGSRPFQPFLQREEWETSLELNSTGARHAA